MTDMHTLVLVDKELVHVEAFREALLNANDGPFHDEWFQTFQSTERLSEKTIWALFANPALRHSREVDTIKQLLQAASAVPILVMGGTEDEDL
jgi:hypothetical protein